MKRTAGMLILLIILGCSTTHPVNSPDAPSFHTTIGYLKGEKVWLVLKDSTRLHGSILQMDADSIRFYASDSEFTANFPYEKISRVEVIKIDQRGKAAGQGALWGMAVAGVLGGTLFYATAPDHCNQYDDWGCIPKSKAIAVGIFSSLGGILPGALIGGLVGHQEIYQYQIGDTLNNVPPEIKSR